MPGIASRSIRGKIASRRSTFILSGSRRASRRGIGRCLRPRSAAEWGQKPFGRLNSSLQIKTHLLLQDIRQVGMFTSLDQDCSHLGCNGLLGSFIACQRLARFHVNFIAFISAAKSGSSLSHANLGSTLDQTSQLERSSNAFRIQATVCSLSLSPL